ncbi:Beta-lactamase class C and other penicillin binding protein [Lunatimonas lonarensis]|uniref:Beta-lactamase class C and other penicillin binding protein n=1 Tax=Lunatimonas lonarensis TaxID=1232681 RepID=R7ZS09_9BACT|nr:serine hydrolase domain-containing protein [Lunatimonas lonarensis]EON76833.1 Beta-lactamase class C and other penicillin binding protein [Lunatimonas lonarensis]
MKSTLIFGFGCLMAIACNSPQVERGEGVGMLSSTPGYVVPTFEDSASFYRLTEAYPVVERMFFDFAEQNHYPALSFGVIAGGTLQYSGSQGVADIETGRLATNKTLYRIASMSKSFTAMAILKLRDEGKLNLLDPVAKYLPEMKLAGRLTTDAPEINLQHLLTMSAGFPEDNPWGDRQLDVSDEQLLDLLRQGLSLSNVPGTTYEYSNLGYALLGKVIHVVSGRTYQRYITEEILIPLGMHDTKWEYTDIPVEALAWGYRWTDGTWEPEPYLHDGAYGAMGGLISSIDDFAKYVAFHLDAWPARNEPETGPVRRSSLREMHQPVRFNNLLPNATTPGGEACASATAYGYGLSWLKDCRGRVRVAHSGGLPGFGSEWRIYPEYGIGIVSFSNRTYGSPAALNAQALDTLIALADLRPRKLKASPLLEERKSALVAVLKNDWPEDMLGIFADNFFLDRSLASRKSELAELLERVGPVQRVSEIQALNQLRGSFLLECTNGNMEVYFTLNPQKEGFVQQLNLTVRGIQ